VAERTGGRWPRKPPLDTRAKWRWVHAWPLGTHTPPKPHITLRRTPTYVDMDATIPSRSSPYRCTHGHARRRGCRCPIAHVAVDGPVWRGAAERDVGTQRRSE
jgi:hypothetical protein